MSDADIQRYRLKDENTVIGPTGKTVMIRTNGKGRYILVKNKHIYLSEVTLAPFVEEVDMEEWRDVTPAPVIYQMSVTQKIRNKTTKSLMTITQAVEGGQRIARINGGHQDVDQLYERIFPDKVDLKWLDDLIITYPQIKRNEILAVTPAKRAFLMIYAAPQLLNEWDFGKNRDISTAHIWDQVLDWWICKEEKHPFTGTIEHRLVREDGCRECSLERIRILDAEVVRKHRENFDDSSKPNPIAVGDATEEWVMELLAEAGISATRLGNVSNCKFDILVDTGSGEQRGVQVKTLSKVVGTFEGYLITSRMPFSTLYEPNTLMIMIDATRKRFILRFAQELNGLSASFTFNQDMDGDMFTEQDKDEFIDRLREMLEVTIIVTDITKYIAPTALLEYNSLLRLEKECNRLGLLFRRNNTNGDATDCYINDIPIQCKFSSIPTNSAYTYVLRVHKCCGKIQGKRIQRPYSSKDDFRYLICEVGGTESDPDKYKDWFCVIPMSVLEERGIVSIEGKGGQTTLSICPPDYPKPHWSLPYWGGLENIV